MKSETIRLTHKAKRLSTRTVALILSVVMLITAIGTGSMLNTFAAYISNQADNGAVSDAAAAGSDIAEGAVPSEDAAAEADNAANAAPAEDEAQAPDLSGFEENEIVRGMKQDLADTGAKVDLAGSGSNLQTGARIYFNAYGAFSSIEDYVYIAWIFNSGKNYTIVRLRHIDNTNWYTEVTSSSNVYAQTDVSNILFFTTDASGWATKSEYRSSADCYSNITNNVTDYVNFATTSLWDCYNNHVYYCDSTGKIEEKNDGNKLANDSGTLSTKSGQQKVSVYTSKDNSNYTYNGTADEGGEVQIGGYGWATAFTTTAQTFADASDAYSYFDNPVRTSQITIRVNETFPGYYFQGFYKSDGTQLTTNTSYSYYLTTGDSNDIQARFYHPVYEEATPASTTTIPSNTLLFKKGSTKTPNRVSVYDVDSGGVKEFSGNYSSKYYYYTDSDNLTDGCTPKAWVVGGTSTSWVDDDMCSGNISEPADYDDTNLIWYYELTDSTDNGEWENFTHLSTPSVSASPNTCLTGAEVTLTGVKPTSGTLKDGATLSYYYTTDGTTYYSIVEGTSSTSIPFYPTESGTYSFLITATDSEGIETTTNTASNALTVAGAPGYYINGSSTSSAGAWPNTWALTGPSKGKMTQSGTVWTKVYPSLPKGDYEFRITNINNAGEGSWTTTEDNTALSGNSGASIVGGDGDDKNNVKFTLTGKSRVVITFDTAQVDSKYPVTVNVSDVIATTVSVYANTGGSVRVEYEGDTTEVAAGKSATISVIDGDEIRLTATPAEGYSFSKWQRNLNDSYSATASLTDYISGRTVYVAGFTAGGGSSGFDPTGYDPDADFSIKYNDGGNDTYASKKIGGSLGSLTASVYRNGDYDYWIQLSSDDLTAWKDMSKQIRWNLFNSSTDQITDKNGTTVKVSTDGADAVSATGDGLAVKSKMDNYNFGGNNVVFVELSKVASNVTSLGIHYNSSTKTITYYATTKASGGGGGTSYVPSVNYYAKDSTIRSSKSISWMSYVDESSVTHSAVDTVVTPVTNQITVTESGDSYAWESGMAVKGSQITVTTTIADKGSLPGVDKNGNAVSGLTFRQKYYVAGFSFNGITPEVLEENDDGVYTCTYTIPANMTEEMLEITPIYFIRDAYAKNTATFYLNGYDDTIKAEGWSHTLFVYPFYKYYVSGSSGDKTTYEGQAQNFGAYPGQPVINNGGQLYTQIPLTCDGTTSGPSTNGDPIKGVTINNGYFDTVHKTYCSFVDTHKQTYDYDDFAKIAKEKAASMHSIYFSFKYHAEDSDDQHRSYSTTSGASTKSRYNDMYDLTSDVHHSLGATPTKTELDAYDDAGTSKWEYLTNALGDKCDLFGDAVDTSKYPLYVVSMGYEYNNSGEYATEWAVYATSDGTNYSLVIDKSNSIDTTNASAPYNSSIVPSALIMNNVSSFANYTAMDGDLGINGYEKLYTALKDYAGYPVNIVYDYDAYIGYNDPHAYRSDGRWTYTKNTDYVMTDIEIQYKGKGSDEYATDTYTSGTNIGSTTKCKAYFTNDDYYGETTSPSEIISNLTKDQYTFKAEEGGSYVFAGWFMKDAHDKESTISLTDKEAKTLRSGAFTLIARFDYVAAGTLTISNSLDADSSGRGTTYLGVTLVNPTTGKEIVMANVNSNTDSVKLDSSVIKSTSAYDIVIDIRTVASGENKFASYTAYTTEPGDPTDVRSKVTESNDFYDTTHSTLSSDTYTISISELFSGGSQVVNVIEYISTLNAVHYNYSFKFTYTPRQGTSKSYTAEGSLTPVQITNSNYVTGATTTDKTLTDDFIQTVVPYESNFNKDINFTLSDVAVTDTGCSYTEETNTYYFTKEFTEGAGTDKSERHGYFYLPYAVATEGGVKDSKLKADFTVDEVNAIEASDQAVMAEEVTLNDIDSYLMSDVEVSYDDYFGDEGRGFVTAPELLYVPADQSGDEDETDAKVYFFSHWVIKTASSSDLSESRIIGKCYFPEMNYRALGDYDIYPVYEHNDDQTQPTYGQDYNAYEGTTVSYIGSNRNQWNKGDAVGAHSTITSGDLVYNDFIINFKPYGADLINTMETAKVGLIVQQVQRVDVNSGGKAAYSLKQYENNLKTALDSNTDLKTALTNLANGASTSDSTNRLVKYAFDVNDVNNKNRYHYVMPLYNSKNGTTYSNCKALYRAFSYMVAKDASGEGHVYISEEPAYFYMYDLANE